MMDHIVDAALLAVVIVFFGFMTFASEQVGCDCCRAWEESEPSDGCCDE